MKFFLKNFFYLFTRNIIFLFFLYSSAILIVFLWKLYVEGLYDFSFWVLESRERGWTMLWHYFLVLKFPDQSYILFNFPVYNLNLVLYNLFNIFLKVYCKVKIDLNYDDFIYYLYLCFSGYVLIYFFVFLKPTDCIYFFAFLKFLVKLLISICVIIVILLIACAYLIK